MARAEDGSPGAQAAMVDGIACLLDDGLAGDVKDFRYPYLDRPLVELALRFRTAFASNACAQMGLTRSYPWHTAGTCPHPRWKGKRQRAERVVTRGTSRRWQSHAAPALRSCGLRGDRCATNASGDAVHF